MLKEYDDDLVMLGVTFDSKMTFEKHFRSVFRVALGILRKSWRVFYNRSLLGRCFLGLVPSRFWSTVLQYGVRLPIHTLTT